MKIAELSQLTTSAQPRQPAAEPAAGVVSDEKKSAKNPSSAMDAAHFDKDRLNENPMKAAERLSEMSNHRLKFEYQEDADVFQVSVVDESNKVIRKIPTDEMLRIIENIERLLGLSVDTMM